MAAPENDDKPALSPLDAEREKLRKAGYNETEISQILVARALGSPGHSADAPTGQGVLSGTLSSVMAIGSYARGTAFTIRNDLATIFDRTAFASARVGAAVMLVFKVAVISVLAYAGWQEWRQHIISATEIAESQARKIRAEECTARVEAAAKNMRLSDLENGIYSNEELARDCDANYAHRKALEAACSAKLNAIVDVISTLSADEFKAKIDEHKKVCAITDADREAANARIAVIEKERKQRVAELSDQMLVTVKAKEQFDAGHYDEAYKLANDNAIAANALETKTQHKPGDLTAIALGELSWYGLFAHQYAQALEASERSLKLKASLNAETNHAHALMLLGRTAEAKAIYLAHKGEPIEDKTWEKVISDDFDKLRHAGITDPLMAEIEAALVSFSQPSASMRQLAPLPAPIDPRPPVTLPEEKTSPPEKTMAAVVTDQLTLRAQPDKSAEAIVVLNKGTQVEVISTDENGWRQVRLSDRGTSFEGYVNGKYLTSDLSATPQPVILTEPTDRDKAPSYCGHENAPIEFVICSNSDLASQDGAMEKSYRLLLVRIKEPDALRMSQRKWNLDRRSNCNVASDWRPARQIPADLVQCVFKITEARTRDLRAGRY
jgi:uncharacterized protein YgiM (DUF1202 family)